MLALGFQIAVLAALAVSLSVARNISPSSHHRDTVQTLPACTELNTRKSWSVPPGVIVDCKRGKLTIVGTR